MRRRTRLSLLFAMPVLVVSCADARALQCGVDVCEVAGNVTGSPLGTGGFGSFETSVDMVNDTLVGRPPENAGDTYAHAWRFSLTERAHLSGTLTKDNTLANFQQHPVSLQLFSQEDLADSIGGSFEIPFGLQPNPFVAFRFANLEPGFYFFKVKGTLVGDDGQYAGQLGVNQVPLPSAVWLFLAALLGLVTIVRMRRPNR